MTGNSENCLIVARCLLEDVPAAAFKVLLTHLNSSDHASLRQVNSYISNITTKNIPFITLFLSGGCSLQHVQQWCQATKRLQHVSNVHVRLSGDVSEAVFDSAMRLLSERSSPVRELHLLAVQHHGRDSATQRMYNRAASLSSLQPLKHLIAGLNMLVLEGFETDLSNSVQQLVAEAPAEGWQLQKLVLTAHWCEVKPVFHDYEGTLRWVGEEFTHWSEFASVLLCVTAAFPWLRHLDIQFPPQQFMWHGDDELPDDIYTRTDDVHVAKSGATNDGASDVRALDNIIAAIAAAERKGIHVTSDCMHEQLAEAAVVAALANAMLQLRCLEVLKVTEMPDVWLSIPQEYAKLSALPHSMPKIQNVARAPPKASEVLQASFVVRRTGRSLPSVTAAATTFKTFDTYGCWLMHCHPVLTELHIETESGWSMSWQQQKQPPRPQHGRNNSLGPAGMASDAEAAAVQDPQLRWCINKASFVAVKKPGMNYQDSSIVTLSCYSFRPAAVVLHNINSCSLQLTPEEVDNGLNV